MGRNLSAVNKEKTIKFSELKRLSFCNSDKLPSYIKVTGKVRGKQVTVYKWWTGIGWVDVDLKKCRKTPVLVVEG